MQQQQQQQKQQEQDRIKKVPAVRHPIARSQADGSTLESAQVQRPPRSEPAPIAVQEPVVERRDTNPKPVTRSVELPSDMAAMINESSNKMRSLVEEESAQQKKLNARVHSFLQRNRPVTTFV